MIMNNRLIIVTVGLFVALGLGTTAWGFEIQRAKTEAEILLSPNPVTPVIQLNFKAHLANDGFATLPSDDVVVTWEKVGGIQPQPFIVLIPAGCFVPNRGFHVEDFLACGVRMTVDLGRGQIALAIREFETKLRLRRDGTALFVMETRFTDAGQEPAILGALGGAAVEIAIGAEMATALPGSIETVSGIEPTPF